MFKLFSLFLFAMWTVYLLARVAERITRWQREKKASGPDQGEWEIIEPAERDDGTPVRAALSQGEKARRVFGGRLHTEPGPLEKHVVQIGFFALGILMLLTLLILVPALIVALR